MLLAVLRNLALYFAFPQFIFIVYFLLIYFNTDYVYLQSAE